MQSNIPETQRNLFYHIHLNLCIGLSCTNMTSVLNQILQQFTSRGRPKHCGILFLLEYTSLVANSDAVAVGMK